MMTRSRFWLVAIPVLGVASCGGQFSTQATSGADAGLGGSGEGGSSAGGRHSGGSTSTGGRKTGGVTGRGGAIGVGGSLGGGGGFDPGTGGVYPGGSTGAGGTISSGTEAQFRASLISVYCDVFVNCCAASIPLDHTQCVTTLTSLISRDLTSPRPGYYTFDAQAGANCLQTVRSSVGSTCASLPTTFACDGVYQGILKPGDACNGSVECAHGPGEQVSCSPGPNGPNICIVEYRASEGQACQKTCTEQGPTTSCGGLDTSPDQGRCYTNDGLFCSAGVCSRQSDVGGLCSDSQYGCLAGSQCDTSLGICVPLGSVGDPCTYTSDCREELHCDTTNGKCVLDFAEGQACSASTECGKGSCTNGVCSAVDASLTLLCSVLQGGITVPPPPVP